MAQRIRLAVGMLALCCVFWGFSFPVMQFAADAFERSVTRAGIREPGFISMRATFNAWRFGASALIYAGMLAIARLAYRQSPGPWRSGEIRGGMAVGFFFAAGMVLQLGGLRYTLPSISSFLTSLAVVFAPLGQALLFRQPVGRITWMAVALALLGILVLSQSNAHAAAANTLAQRPSIGHLGEALTIVGSVMFTGQILSLAHYGQQADARRLTVIMLFVTGLLSAAAGALTGSASLYSQRLVRELASNAPFVWSMAALVLVSTILALHLMNRFQPVVTAATASVVYCLEPAFGTLWSIAFRTERLTTITLTGGAVILAAVLLVALAPAKELAAGPEA